MCIRDRVEKAQKEVETMIREEGENAALEVGVHGIHPELIRLLGRMKFRSSYGQNALKHSIEVAQLSGLLAAEVGTDIRLAKRAGLLHDIGKSIDHEVEGSHIQIGVDLCRKYKESPIVINAVEAHHGDVEPESLIAGIVQAADAISVSYTHLVNAVTCAEITLSGVMYPIPFDEMVDAMYKVGKSIPFELRETAIGGCAGTPTGCGMRCRI